MSRGPRTLAEARDDLHALVGREVFVQVGHPSLHPDFIVAEMWGELRRGGREDTFLIGSGVLLVVSARSFESAMLTTVAGHWDLRLVLGTTGISIADPDL